MTDIDKIWHNINVMDMIWTVCERCHEIGQNKRKSLGLPSHSWEDHPTKINSVCNVCGRAGETQECVECETHINRVIIGCPVGRHATSEHDLRMPIDGTPIEKSVEAESFKKHLDEHSTDELKDAIVSLLVENTILYRKSLDEK